MPRTASRPPARRIAPSLRPRSRHDSEPTHHGRGHGSMSGIPSDQVLAILRLRQWAVDRNALKCGRTTRMTHAGWRERRETDADARNVRVIDFEKALATL